MITPATTGEPRSVPQPFALVHQELAELDLLLLHESRSVVDMVSDISRHILAAGGKRIRPALLLMSARAAGRQNEWTLKLAACMELLHTATLMHDDVVDHSNTRRGVITAHERWGSSASVLSGDVMFAKAMRILVDYGDLTVLDAVTSAIIRVCEGEVMELAVHGELRLAVDTYVRIIDAKTASLISVCCRVGGIAGGASPEMIAALTRFGLHLGRAFQIMDDLMDLTAEEAEWGKPIGKDLKEGRITLPLIHTLQQASPADSSRLRQLIASPEIDAADVQEAVRLAQRYGGLAAARDEAETQVRLAKEYLAVLPPSEARAALNAIADYAILRDR